MSSNSGFGPTFSAVWLRLVALGVVSLVFGEALWLAPGKAQGWSYYLTTAEVLFEVAVRLVVAALFGMALGTVCALVIAPFLWFFKASRDFLVDSVTKVTVVLVVFLLSRYSLEVLIKWSYGISNHPALYDKLLLGAQFVVFAVALCVPRARRVVVTGLDGLLTPKMTRRTAVATMAGGASLVPWLNGKASGEGEGLAFAQYLEKNSVFKPLRHGTVGMIDGRTLHQYVIDLESQKGTLRPLSEAQYWNLDRSAQNPELAQQLRATIASRFPDLVRIAP